MKKPTEQQITDYAIKEYQQRQERVWNGDPSGFAIWWNNRSKKLTHTALYTRKKIGENYEMIARVYSNGSLEIAIE